MNFHADAYRENGGPERRLIWAILESAIVDATQSSHQHRRKRNRLLELDAIKWFRSPSQAPFSFLWICEMLGFDPVPVRRFVRSNKECVFSSHTYVSMLENLENNREEYTRAIYASWQYTPV